MATINNSINHVALSVPNLDEAVDFYQKAFGFQFIFPPVTQKREQDPDGQIFKMYGEDLKSVRIALMTTGNSVGFEIFEFTDPPMEASSDQDREWNPKKYTRGGFFHICLTVPDPVDTLKRAEPFGAKLVGEVTHHVPGETCLYMMDPWGNVLELLSCSWEHLFVKVLGQAMQSQSTQ